MKKNTILMLLLSLAMMTGCSSNTNVPEEKRVRLLEDGVVEYINGEKSIDAFKDSCLDRQKEYTINISEDDNVYQFYISLNKNFSDSLIFNDVVKSITLTNLLIDTTYYTKVVQDGKTISTSSFTTQSFAPRFINVDGINNVRDIGGWKCDSGKKIAQGLIYRGSEMNKNYTITEQGKDVMVKSLKIKTDLDLRTKQEANNITSSPLGESVNYVPIPTFKSYIGATQDEQIANYKKAFKLLVDPSSYPIYVHCYQGADRTGTFIAMIEGLMGVSDEDRLKDYNITTFSSGKDCFRDGMKKNYLFIQRNISALYQADTFKESMERYLKERLEMTDEEISTIRKILSGETKIATGDIAFRK